MKVKRLNCAEDIHGHKAAIYSFDVFDTVLARATPTPDGIFSLLDRKIRASGNGRYGTINNFYQIRKTAEKEARKEYGLKACRIHDIYRYLSDKFRIPKEVCHRLIELEFETEMEHIRPVPLLKEVLNELREKKARIIFVSDMYWSSEMIKSMLRKAGCYKEGEKIYVSNEYGVTKWDGGLYDEVIAKERCPAGQILHMGDNWQADVKLAMKKGLKCLYFRKTHCNRYEETLIEMGRLPEEHSPGLELTAGASRLARLRGLSDAGGSPILYDLGASLVAPVLLSFTLWILNEAKKKGLKKLYFIARDGQVLLEIARKVQKHIEIDMELRYLYGSRQAWVLACTDGISEEQLDFLFLKTPYLSLRLLSERTGLNMNDIRKEFRSNYGKDILPEEELNDQDERRLRALFAQEPIRSALVEVIREQNSRVKAYFRQEGLFAEMPFGIVDLGWKGSMQDALERILGYAHGPDNPELVGFYFGVTKTAGERLNKNRKLGFCFSPDDPHSVLLVEETLYLLETFTAADHGLTLSYDFQGETQKWQPRLKEDKNTDALQWGLQSLREGIDSFIESFPPAYLNDIGSMDMNLQRKIAASLLRIIVYDPTIEEAAAVGEYRLKRDPNESFFIRLAEPFKFSEVLKYAPQHRKRHLNVWYKGSDMRSTFATRCFIRLLTPAFYRKLFAKIKDVCTAIFFVCGQIYAATQVLV